MNLRSCPLPPPAARRVHDGGVHSVEYSGWAPRTAPIRRLSDAASGLVEETVRTGRKSRRRQIARAAGSLALQLKCVVKHLNTLLHALRSEV